MPFCDTNFDFQILIRTEAGNEYAYCGYQASNDAIPARPRNFIATHWDGYNSGSENFSGAWSAHGSAEHDQYVFSSGEIYNKIQYMQSCSFVDGQYGESGVPTSSLHGAAGNASDLFKNAASTRNIGIEATLGGHDFYNDGDQTDDNTARQTSTGSISFKQVSGQVDPVKEVKFWGQKVCDVLGVPEAVWISMDAVHVDASANKHSFRGDIVGSNMVVHQRFTIPQAGDIGGGLPFKIHYNTSDKLIRFMDTQTDNPKNEILIGYARDVHHGYDSYPAGPYRYRISTRGAIGAGTLTPAYALHVSASWYQTDDIAAIFEGGRVGIGTLTPKEKLEVKGNIKISGSTHGNHLKIYNSNTSNSTNTDFITLEGHNSDVSTTGHSYAIKFLNSDGNSSATASIKMKVTQGMPYDDEGAGNLVFATSKGNPHDYGVESDKMIITGRGRVGIGGNFDKKLNAKFDVSSSGGHFLADWDGNVYGTMIAPRDSGIGGWARGYHFGKLDGDGTVTKYGGFGGHGDSDDTFYRWYIGEGHDNYGMSIEYSDHSAKFPNDVEFQSDVGIGTASPKGKLHIVGETWATIDDGDNGLRIRPGIGHIYGFTSDATNNVVLINEQGTANQAIFLGDANATGGGVLFGISNTVSGTGNATTGEAAESWVPRFSITGTGKVGIGTNNPVFTSGTGLMISDSTQANLRLADGSDYTDVANSGGDMFLINRTSTGKIAFWIDNSDEAMRISPEGKDGEPALDGTNAGPEGYVTVDGHFNVRPKTAGTTRGPMNALVQALMGAGRCCNPDVDFAYGRNGVYKYDNNGTADTSVTRVEWDSFCALEMGFTSGDGETAPNDSGYVLKVENTGGNPPASTPGHGGFYQHYWNKSADEKDTEMSHTYVQIFQAVIPDGRRLVTAQNGQGDGAAFYWLTSNKGTGKWEWYARVCHAGDAGTMSSGGHVYMADQGLDGTVWYLAHCSAYDITDPISNHLVTKQITGGWVRGDGGADIPLKIGAGYSVPDEAQISTNLGHYPPETMLHVRGDIGTGTVPGADHNAGNDQLIIQSRVNAKGAGIGFTDIVGSDTDGTWGTASQKGHLRFWHSDNCNDIGVGAIFRMSSDQQVGFQLTGSGDAVLDVQGKINSTTGFFKDGVEITGGSGDSNTGMTISTGDNIMDWNGPGYLKKITDQGGVMLSTDSCVWIYCGDHHSIYQSDNISQITGGVVAGTTTENLYLGADGNTIIFTGAQESGYDYGSSWSWVFSNNSTLYCPGDVVAYYTSDKKLKKNIIKIDNAISKISQLNGMTFEWKREVDEKYENKRNAGIIAQDVQKVLPEAVMERKDGNLAVDYEQLIPLLIEGIKEQQEQINELKSEVETLKGRDNV